MHKSQMDMFLKRAIFEKRIPFEIEQQPSKELTNALKELDYMETHLDEYKTYHDVDAMFKDILNM